MKKYKVWGQIGTHSFDYEIEANYFTFTTGVYSFSNSETNQKWYFPINRTVVQAIVE